MRYAWLLLLALLLGARHSSAQMHPQLALISQGDAINDAKKAAQSGDWRFWAYHNRIGLISPGVELPKQALYRIAPDMSDTVSSPEQLQVRKQFIDYATDYNQQLLRLQQHHSQ